MKLITVIQYLSLAYQTYHCSTMLLCSPVSVSFCLHLLGISDLLFFSTRAPQPSFSVLLSCSTHSLHFLCFCLLCSMCHVHSMLHSSSLYFSCCSLLLLHSRIPLNNNNTHLFSVLHTYSLCAPCACCPTMLLHALSCRVLYLFIMETLQLLW
jgi:hypothetical protein